MGRCSAAFPPVCLGAGNGMIRERELKLEIDPAAVQRVAQWVRHARARRTAAMTMQAVYYDTDDFSIFENGLSWRVRHSPDGYTQTIKGPDAGAAGLFDRAEWEGPVTGFQPDAARARKTGLKILNQRNLGRKLHPVFEIETRRTQFQLPGKDRVLVTLDRGRITAGKRHARFCEIELEAPDGRPGGLFRTGKALAKIASGRIETASKSARGYALLRDAPPRAVRAGHVPLLPETTAEDAFRVIARECLRQLTANMRATAGGSPEALHQMRVALRRLRASISAFSEMLEGGQTGEMKSSLRWLGRSLGTARDLDVLLADMHHRDARGAVLKSVISRFEKRRQNAYDGLKKTLSSGRFRSLMLDVLAWIECGNWRTRRGPLAKSEREQPVIAHAARELRQRYRKLAKHLDSLPQLDPAGRHQVRIRAKRLRYAVEFFGDVFAGKKNIQRRDALLSALKDLQSALGDLNDIANRDRLVSEIALPKPVRGAGGEMSPGTAVALYRPAEPARLLKAAADAAQRIKAAKPFWR